MFQQCILGKGAIYKRHSMRNAPNSGIKVFHPPAKAIMQVMPWCLAVILGRRIQLGRDPYERTFQLSLARSRNTTTTKPEFRWSGSSRTPGFRDTFQSEASSTTSRRDDCVK
jgi:hypothetical protein